MDFIHTHEVHSVIVKVQKIYRQTSTGVYISQGEEPNFISTLATYFYTL